MLDLGTLLITTGAAARLTRLVTTDTITEPARTALLTRIAHPKPIRTLIHQGQPAPPPTRARAWVLDLATCPWCIGFWITALTISIAHLAGDALSYQIAATILAASYIVGWLANNEANE